MTLEEYLTRWFENHSQKVEDCKALLSSIEQYFPERVLQATYWWRACRLSEDSFQWEAERALKWKVTEPLNLEVFLDEVGHPRRPDVILRMWGFPPWSHPALLFRLDPREMLARDFAWYGVRTKSGAMKRAEQWAGCPYVPFEVTGFSWSGDGIIRVSFPRWFPIDKALDLCAEGLNKIVPGATLRVDGSTLLLSGLHIFLNGMPSDAISKDIVNEIKRGWFKFLNVPRSPRRRWTDGISGETKDLLDQMLTIAELKASGKTYEKILELVDGLESVAAVHKKRKRAMELVSQIEKMANRLRPFVE